MVNIAFSGMTAAGKTTHARLLATRLSFRYVSAIDVILDVLGVDWDPAGVWSRRPELFAAFKDPELNLAVDARLVGMSRSLDDTVFDAWALPWLSDAPMMRIWLESDLASRMRKAHVSTLRSGQHATAPSVVERKDAASIANFQSAYGFDLGTDRHPFDVIVENSSLIPEATIECSDAGIEQFEPIVASAAESWLRGGGETSQLASASHQSFVQWLH